MFTAELPESLNNTDVSTDFFTLSDSSDDAQWHRQRLCIQEHFSEIVQLFEDAFFLNFFTIKELCLYKVLFVGPNLTILGRVRGIKTSWTLLRVQPSIILNHIL